MDSKYAILEVLIDVCIGIFCVLQWLVYLVCGIKAPPHTSQIFQKHFYTLRLALPLRLLLAFWLYVLLIKPFI